MLTGLELFRDAFRKYSDCYILVGGVACVVNLDALAIPFRATKDLDIVLCLENTNADFGRTFWKFIRDGGYRIQETATGKKCFYRFGKPENNNYPFQLELFSRLPDSIFATKESELVPIPLDDSVSSLSAILLNDEYYSFILQNRIIKAGLTTVSVECLIVLKAKAFVDLQYRKATGKQQVDSRNIRKHRNDIIRLYMATTSSTRIQLSDSLRCDVQAFLDQMDHEDIDVKSLGLPISPSDFKNGIRRIFLE
ncbi:MAG: hypothetical protein Q4G59_02245 [Planctomycetia bacterium]|nr:hypothetical protein [Planctomycetia bacterium]